MAEEQLATQYASKSKLSIWTLPQGSPPAVRVEVSHGKITASRLLQIVFDTLGVQERSRPFFSLFKGLDPPIKKYGEDEIIYTPCQSIISIQRWSFDATEEARAIKTDTASIRLLALQIKADIAARRLTLTSEEKEQLDKLVEPAFPCYKQYVDLARNMPSYATAVVKDARLVKSVRLRTQTLRKGNRIDIACSSKRMIIVAESMELHIPWRKVRRWSQGNENYCLGYELYLMEEKAFTWIEFETEQAGYLLQVTGELVARLNDRLQADCNKSEWTPISRPRKKLTWSLFKREIFGGGREASQEESVLDNLEDMESSGEDEDGASLQRESKPLRLGKKASGYLCQ